MPNISGSPGAADHDVDVGAISALTLGGDNIELDAWLGTPPPEVTVVGSERGVVEVGITLAGERRVLAL